jgi:hypothetical protein
MSNGHIAYIVPVLSADYAKKTDRDAIQQRIDAEYQTYADFIAGQGVTEPYDKVRLIHDMMCAKTDYSIIDIGGSYRADNRDSAHDIRGVMDPSAYNPVCESYAEAFAYIINRLGVPGLEALTVLGVAGEGGNGGGGGHAWNIIKLSGSWYFLDVTWDNIDNTNPNSRQYDDGNSKNMLYYKYFLCGTSNANWGDGTTHKSAVPNPASIGGTNYFMYGLPAISSGDYNRAPVSRDSTLPAGTYRYLTDNGFMGRNNSFADFNTAAAHDNYDYVITKTAKPYSGDKADNPILYDSGSAISLYYGPYNLGTVPANKPAVPLYMYPYRYDQWSWSDRFSDAYGLPWAGEPDVATRVDLVQGTDYDVVLEPGNTGDTVRAWFYGKAGSNYKGIDFAWVTLASDSDTAAPVVDTVTPDGAHVPLDGNIVITFNEEMNTAAGTVQLGTLSPLSGGSWSNGNKTFTVAYSGLSYSANYTVKISGFKDISGNVMSADNTHTFTTLADTVAPKLHGGKVRRHSHTSAMVEFTTSKHGTAYYKTVRKGHTAPTKDEILNASNLGSVSGTVTDKSISLTIGEHDVYIVVKDNSGNISEPLLISVAGMPDMVVDIPEIAGVLIPLVGAATVGVIPETEQYTGTVTWAPSVNTFDFDTVYTATITLSPKAGFTLTGVSANYFTVQGATATNSADSGVVTAVFPKTAINQQAQDDSLIASAKDTIENVSYTAPQNEIIDENAAAEKVAAILAGLDLRGVTHTITKVDYVPAAAGTEASPNGTDGSYVFAVLLEKGVGTPAATVNLTLTITATPYTPAGGGDEATDPGPKEPGDDDTHDKPDRGEWEKYVEYAVWGLLILLILTMIVISIYLCRPKRKGEK